MQFEALDIDGVFAVHLDLRKDDRGFFARSFSVDEFLEKKLVGDFSQSSISYNLKAGTVRGMHYSVGPHAETKLVRCTAGSILDVLVDIRSGSRTYGRRLCFSISAENRVALYIPKGIAHGFQTIVAETEILYMIDTAYDVSASRGFRYNDRIAQIRWPLPIAAISDRDAGYPDFEAE